MKLLKSILHTVSRWGWLLFVVEPKLTEACPASEKRILALCGWVACLNHVLLAIAAVTISQLIANEPVIIVVISLLLFFGISAMYRLLMTTFSSDRLPHTAEISKFNSSILVSFFFLIFMSLLVAKPLELILFQNGISEYLVEYRLAKSKSFLDNNLAYLDQEIELVENKLNPHLSYSLELEKTAFRKRLNELCQKRQQYINDFEFANANSKDILARFQLLYEHFKESWWISLVVLILFLIPFLAKITWLKTGTYQLKCDNNDYELILSSFFHCQSRYKNIFQSSYQVEVSLYDDYYDPPFNTRKREDTRKVAGLASLRERIAQNQDEA